MRLMLGAAAFNVCTGFFNILTGAWYLSPINFVVSILVVIFYYKLKAMRFTTEHMYL